MHADTAPALDQLATPVLWLDADGCIAGANPACARWLGVGLRRLPGLPLPALEAEGDALARALAEPPGREFARLRRVPMAFPGGGPARFADLLLSRREDGGWWLEAQPVDEFPGEDPAVALPSALSAALKGLAHELRNPLAAIRYAVTLGQMSSDDTGEVYEIVERQVENLAHLVDDLLDVSRISRDKIKLVREHIDARTIVERAAAAARPFIEEKQHALKLDISPLAMPLHVDPTRAEQIVGNLLANAAKYTPPEGRITLRAFPEDNQCVIKVADNGVGLPVEMLARIFELFAQADRSLDRSAGGLGIGLTVARRLAEMHGGSIAATSAGLGLGAEFTVRLPLVPVPAESEPPRAADTAPVAAQKILVVDDNRDTARTAALLLEASGHEVQTAHDGPTALEIARQFRPQSILLDIGLPGLNGYEVARTLRNEGFEQTTIVAISGYGQAEDRQRSREAGFDHHLVKPVNHRVLLDVLRAGRTATNIGS